MGAQFEIVSDAETCDADLLLLCINNCLWQQTSRDIYNNHLPRSRDQDRICIPNEPFLRRRRNQATWWEPNKTNGKEQLFGLPKNGVKMFRKTHL